MGSDPSLAPASGTMLLLGVQPALDLLDGVWSWVHCGPPPEHRSHAGTCSPLTAVRVRPCHFTATPVPFLTPLSFGPSAVLPAPPVTSPPPGKSRMPSLRSGLPLSHCCCSSARPLQGCEDPPVPLACCPSRPCPSCFRHSTPTADCCSPVPHFSLTFTSVLIA